MEAPKLIILACGHTERGQVLLPSLDFSQRLASAQQVGPDPIPRPSDQLKVFLLKSILLPTPTGGSCLSRNLHPIETNSWGGQGGRESGGGSYQRL